MTWTDWVGLVGGILGFVGFIGSLWQIGYLRAEVDFLYHEIGELYQDDEDVGDDQLGRREVSPLRPTRRLERPSYLRVLGPDDDPSA